MRCLQTSYRTLKLGGRASIFSIGGPRINPQWSLVETIQRPERVYTRGQSATCTLLVADPKAMSSSPTPRPGIEPGSPAWRAEILTTMLPRTWLWRRSRFPSYRTALTQRAEGFCHGSDPVPETSGNQRHCGPLTCTLDPHALRRLRSRELNPGLPRDGRKY